ncbi:MAG: hypothetical protein GEV03_13465 [Streptosporangiales bacterium]|nr:hypothetical protein [Streptosporangiales bacterium]
MTGIAAYVVGQLAVSRTRIRLRFRVRCLLVLLGSALFLVVVRLAVLGGLSLSGHPDVLERLSMVLTLVAVPAAATLVCSVPRLWRLTCGVVADPWGPADAGVRGEASAPRLVVPVQAVAVGAALVPFRSLLPPALPPPAAVAVLGAVLAGGTALLWAWQRRRCGVLSEPSLSYLTEVRMRRAYVSAEPR